MPENIGAVCLKQMGWKGVGEPLGPALGNSSSKGLTFPLHALRHVGGRSGHGQKSGLGFTGKKQQCKGEGCQNTASLKCKSSVGQCCKNCCEGCTQHSFNPSMHGSSMHGYKDDGFVVPGKEGEEFEFEHSSGPSMHGYEDDVFVVVDEEGEEFEFADPFYKGVAFVVEDEEGEEFD